jgi:hypothetical protein
MLLALMSMLQLLHLTVLLQLLLEVYWPRLLGTAGL